MKTSFKFVLHQCSYEYVPVPGNRTPNFEDSVFGKGAVSYVINNVFCVGYISE